ncbi:flagellar hook-associated protein FlgL [Pleionea litopenaei]|uniref:Flagellar hook-associated protein FlgL n=1 Tax=Pleionea litopenaei TaxID=3070815 RepID=A0AA51RUA9_9GAMM|nr:flagellar hook-associated protein FlgL [Pleionea sp. HL-JVS1]WMS87650.1 flagellar hook-associated protein FlgL [Pleionea sp. HL-JVS1]
MRISTNQLSMSGLREILNRQADLRDLQLRLATQKKFLTPADDPVAATSVLNLDTDIALTEQYNRNADLAQSSNELEESILSSVTTINFRIKELFVSLGDGAYQAEELNAIKLELQQRRDELVGLANSRNSSGEYLFSGFQTQTKPFTEDAAGNIIYNGDQGQRNLRVSSGLTVPISDSGFDVFINSFNGNGKIITGSNAANTGTGVIEPINTGNASIVDDFEIQFTSDTTYDIVNLTTATVIQSGTYTEGSRINFAGVAVEINGTPLNGDVFTVNPSQRQSIFDTLDNVINAIENYDSSEPGRAQFRNTMIAMDDSFENNMTMVDNIRSKIGTRLNSIDEERSTNQGLILTQKQTLSKLQDLDMVEAASELSRQTTVLEAAQSSFVRVQNLSIFRFL